MKSEASVKYLVTSLFCFFVLFLPQQNNAQTITTIAGTGTAGYSGDGGSGTEAMLNLPAGLAFDIDGNLLIADQENYVIRKLDLQTGIITTIAGKNYPTHYGDGGPATLAGIYVPTGIVVDNGGNIYIAEQYSSTIRKIDRQTGLIATIAGTPFTTGYTGDGGLAVDALIDRPTDIDVDQSGNVYFADWENNAVRRIDAATGIITSVAGKPPGMSGFAGDGGPATNALLSEPPRIYLDPAGNLLVADQLNNVIRKVDASSGIIQTIIGIHSGGYFGDGGPAGSAGLNKPAGITQDKAGNIYIADAYNEVIRKVDAVTGEISTIAGNGSTGYSGDGGLSLQASFYRPVDVAIDADGNIYIADARNHAIRKITLCDKVSLGNDTILCHSATLNLSVKNDFVRYQWSTGSNSSVLQVQQPGIYWIAATNANNCTTRDAISVQEFSPSVLNWNKDAAICEAGTVLLNTPPKVTDIRWQDGSSSPTFTIRERGKYWVAFIDTNRCPTSDTVVIDRMIPRPTDFLMDSIRFCPMEAALLTPSGSFVQYLWSTGETARSITINESGKYTLEVEDEHSCIWREAVVVTACEMPVLFPNAFTPNRDGKNDLFRTTGEQDFLKYQLIIYNRWGQKVFETNVSRQGWNGELLQQPQPAGSYVWQLRYQLRGEPHVIRRGAVILIR